MLFGLVLASSLSIAVCLETRQPKPYVFPIPFEMPNRNERADQCWVRIEDVEYVETIAMYCYIAHDFLRTYVRDYNSRKMAEDEVDVSLWNEEPMILKELTIPKTSDILGNNGHLIKDWKATTVLDPITHMRLYVSQNADCHLIMYSREGMTNYRTDCEKILYYLNHHMTGDGVLQSPKLGIFVIMSVLTIIISDWWLCDRY